jgi:hypothetical protein
VGHTDHAAVLEAKVAAPAAHIPFPENYYGFIGTALAAQAPFLIIATDPVRFRPAMLAGVCENWPSGSRSGREMSVGS